MIPRLALDDAGRLMGYVGDVTNAEYLASQALLMDAVCMTTAAINAADAFVDGFRYTSTGALRIYDATAGLPASSSTNHGLTMTDDGQVCITTAATAAGDASLRGMLLDSLGRLYVTLLDPAAWFRFGIGITETGQGVSTWADQSGNANDLLQGTDGARPPLQSDNTILFNGTDEFLKCAAFTFDQPETVYLLCKQVTWSLNDNFFDGELVNTGLIFQSSATPNLVAYAGTGSSENANLPVDRYGICIVVFNGASSEFQINNTTSISGNFGAANMGGFTLGSNGGGGGFANIQVKEAILFPVAHDANTRLHIARYLAHNGLVF